MKVYKVNLYNAKYCNNRSIVLNVGQVIVQRKMLNAKEILTGYSNIDIMPKNAMKDNGNHFPELNKEYWNLKKAKGEGVHLFIVSEELNETNKVKAEEIDNYVEQFEESNWKLLYEKMKVFTKEDKQKVNHKVKQVIGIKK